MSDPGAKSFRCESCGRIRRQTNLTYKSGWFCKKTMACVSQPRVLIDLSLPKKAP
jgi:hypothetical protein